MEQKLAWFRLLKNWQKDLKLGIYIIVLLLACRTSLFLFFVEQRGDNLSFIDYLLCFGRGIQFDIRIGAIAIIPLCLMGIICSHSGKLDKLLNRIRTAYGGVVVFITLCLGVINVAFFYEYHEQFNHWMMGLFFDDPKAILRIIVHDYPVIWVLLLVLTLYVLFAKLLKKWIKDPWIDIETLKKAHLGYPMRISLILIMLLLLIVGARGSIGRRPLQRNDIAITKDRFLNKIIVTPYHAIYYALKSYNEQTGANGIECYLRDSDIHTALKDLYPKGANVSINNIDNWLEHEVSQDGLDTKPKHIFIIVMESQDSWPMLNQYESLEIMPRIKALADEGIWVKSFLPSGSGTMPTLATLITGIPEVGVYTNYQPAARKPFPTALAQQFKSLGYKTNFYYGGYLSWQRLGEFALDQGFDNAYGAGHMGVTVGSEAKVRDKEIFDFILSTLDPNVPSLNLIMTTSNHPRYIVDLAAEDCQLSKIPEPIGVHCDGSVSLKVLGHFRYADKCVGNFVDKAKKLFNTSLFAITGDHWSRHFLNSKPSLYERKSVPLVLYGPEFLKNLQVPAQMAGSHIDIAPTLIELVALKGHKYHSMGRNILDASKEQIGFGTGAVITPNIIWEMNSVNSVEKLTWANTNVKEASPQELARLYNAFHGVSWWRIMKGTEF